MEQLFARRLGSLGAIFSFAGQFTAACGLSQKSKLRLQLVLEELFVNCVEHAVKMPAAGALGDTGHRDEIRIRLACAGSGIRFALTDFEVEPFDPQRIPTPDVSLPIANRQPGGLGLHLVREFADGFDHNYRDGELEISGLIAPGE
jgi:serine/threonine-protein kinase RsbW